MSQTLNLRPKEVRINEEKAEKAAAASKKAQLWATPESGPVPERAQKTANLQPFLRPEMRAGTQEELEQIAHWASRAKTEEGLDQGYWMPWEPPIDIDNLKAVQKGLLHAWCTWVMKQLRSQRDAVSYLAGRALSYIPSPHEAQSSHLDPSLALKLRELPSRLETLEEQEKTMNLRLNKLNDEITRRPKGHGLPLPRTSMSMPHGPDDPTLHDGHRKGVFSEQALKECKHAVQLMANNQQQLIAEQQALRRTIETRLDEFEKDAAERRDKESADLEDKFGKLSTSIEGRLKPLEERFSATDALTQQQEKKGELHSTRLKQVEETQETAAKDVEGLTEDMFTVLGKLGKLEGSATLRRRAAVEGTSAYAEMMAASGTAEDSPSAAEKLKEALKGSDTGVETHAEELAPLRDELRDLRMELVAMIDSLRESIDMRAQEYAEAIKRLDAGGNHRESASPELNYWLTPSTRTNALRGKLPNLPPSSLALEAVHTTKSRPCSGNGPPGPVLEVDIEAAQAKREKELLDERRQSKDLEEEIHAESKEHEETEDRPRRQLSGSGTMHQDLLKAKLQQLQQRQFLPSDPVQEKTIPLKQRHRPPSGGGFRRPAQTSRPSTAVSRPATAGSRPATARR
mmetsp:Transcript_103091/g.183178  ORF Transcript_103091/g.183178 Transcript_103091/m.183178 type:complete len:629 (-) Transcript_103091:16-1902(-)